MQPSRFPYRRVNVVGTSASGKTTFARALAARLGVPSRGARCAALGGGLDGGAGRAAAPAGRGRDRRRRVGGRRQLLGGARHHLGSGGSGGLARLPAAHRALALRHPHPASHPHRRGALAGDRQPRAPVGASAQPRQPAVVDPQHLPPPAARLPPSAGGQSAAGVGAVAVGRARPIPGWPPCVRRRAASTRCRRRSAHASRSAAAP